MHPGIGFSPEDVEEGRLDPRDKDKVRATAGGLFSTFSAGKHVNSMRRSGSFLFDDGAVAHGLTRLVDTKILQLISTFDALELSFRICHFINSVSPSHRLLRTLHPHEENKSRGKTYTSRSE